MKTLDSYKIIAKKLLVESAWDRKFGEPLPTLQDVMNEVDDDKIIKYKKKDGEQGEMKASSAKTMPDDHPAKQVYNKMKGDDSGEKDSSGKLGGSDFERPGSDDKPKVDQPKGDDKPEDEVEVERDDMGVPENEEDWAEEIDSVIDSYNTAEEYLEDSKQELEMAKDEGDEDEIEDAREALRDDIKAFEDAQKKRDAFIQKGGDEGWLDDNDDLEKIYQDKQKLKNRSGSGGGMIGSIGAREKGQGGSGMYDSIKINGKQYKPIKESNESTKPKVHPFKETYKKIGGK